MTRYILAKTALIAVLLLLAASCAPAQNPVLTLRDEASGATADLYPSWDPEDRGLLAYFNERFGYAVKVPHKVFTKVVLLPENGDGMVLASEDGKAQFRVSGGHVMDEGHLDSSFAEAKNAVGTKTISFENREDDSWELCWWEGKTFHRRRMVANEEVWGECEISYPASPEEGTEDPLDDVADRAIRSLGLAKE